MIEAERLSFTMPLQSAGPVITRLGQHLKARRVDANLALRQLSTQSGVRLDVLQRAEAGRWVLTADELDAILAVYS